MPKAEPACSPHTQEFDAGADKMDEHSRLVKLWEQHGTACLLANDAKLIVRNLLAVVEGALMHDLETRDCDENDEKRMVLADALLAMCTAFCAGDAGATALVNRWKGVSLMCQHCRAMKTEFAKDNVHIAAAAKPFALLEASFSSLDLNLPQSAQKMVQKCKLAAKEAQSAAKDDVAKGLTEAAKKLSEVGLGGDDSSPWNVALPLEAPMSDIVKVARKRLLDETYATQLKQSFKKAQEELGVCVGRV